MARAIQLPSARIVFFLPCVLLSYATPTMGFILRVDRVIVGTIATWGTFAILYFVALILNIICMFKADGHRVPYGVLIPVQILFALACLADTTLTIFDNIDKLPPWSVYAAIQAVSALFTNWGLALFFVALVLIVQERQEKYRALTKRDSIVLGQRVMFTVAGSHLLFMIVLGLGTTTGVMATNAYNSLKTGGERFQSRYDTYRNTLFASQAFYYITAGAVIYLARSLFKLMKSTHVSDTVTKVLLYIVSPLYLLHVLVMMSFLIVFNQPNPLPNFNKTGLIACIMQNTLLYLTVLVVLILGLRPTAWTLEIEKSNPKNDISNDSSEQKLLDTTSTAPVLPASGTSPITTINTAAPAQVYRGPSTRSRAIGSVDLHIEESKQTVVAGHNRSTRHHRRRTSSGNSATAISADAENDHFTRMPSRRRTERVSHTSRQR